MTIIGGQLGYKLLRRISAKHLTTHEQSSEDYYQDFERAGQQLTDYFGDKLRERVKDKTVIDFGCGPGFEAIHLSQMGAGKVIGVDIQEKLLGHARDLAAKKSVSDRCTFTTNTDELADVVMSKDAFEHFDDPASILELMADLLKPDGHIEIAFGPIWLHPYGGHLFSVFPWAHLIFTEEALIRWRADFKTDGATKFSEVTGGLNQITIKKFEKIVANSSCKIEWLDTIPIRKLSIFKHKWLREFGSSIVCCRLVKK